MIHYVILFKHFVEENCKLVEFKSNLIFYSDCRHIQFAIQKIPRSNGTTAPAVKAIEPQAAASEESLHIWSVWLANL